MVNDTPAAAARLTVPVPVLFMYTIEPIGKLVVASFSTVSVAAEELFMLMTLFLSANDTECDAVYVFSVIRYLAIPSTSIASQLISPVLGVYVNFVLEVDTLSSVPLVAVPKIRYSGELSVVSSVICAPVVTKLSVPDPSDTKL